MPSLSWNEIRQRAMQFSRDWATETREQAEKQTFWNEFFLVFGIPRRTVASFEEPVQRIKQTYGFIDLLWKGKLLVEHKSAGASLEAAEAQAFDYIQSLQSSDRGDEVPRFILLSDFQRFALYDLEPDEQLDLPLFRGVRFNRIEFPLAEFHRHVHDLAFIPGYKVYSTKPQDAPNLKAVGIMALLHDTLRKGGYTGHDLERFLVRVLFCLFAEDTGIFEPSSFKLYIENRTRSDGSDLGRALEELFATLNTPEPRQHNLDETLKAFPYVNGALFAERLQFAAFNGPMRKAILDAADFDWARISPAIFGALFQEVIKDNDPDRNVRREIGAHYTSERDILKVIKPLFLDSLRGEFESIRADRSTRRDARMADFRAKLTRLKFLDPACGCGNFLVIAYRELRALELDLLTEINQGQQNMSLEEVNRLSRVDVNQFYGIEIEEWPARIAEVALWLMDHQCNMRIHETFGQHFLRLPLRNAPHIHHGNALRMDWNDLLPAAECSYILGNPPFIGHHYQSDAQKDDQQRVMREIPARGVLDYVCNWYVKAADYTRGTRCPAAFVSTNSISQGEQPGILWSYLFANFNLKILFAYRTFPWQSEARGAAHVHVVIIGYAPFDAPNKLIFSESEADGSVAAMPANNISPYLLEGADRALTARQQPPVGVPKMSWGNKPTDGGHLILSEQERQELINECPEAAAFVRRYMSGGDFIDGSVRYCLWLEGATPGQLSTMPPVLKRLEQVRQFRLASKAASTQMYARCPARFRQIAQPNVDYLAIPEVSSERRNYIPMAVLPKSVICSNKIQFIPSADSWLFGVLSSNMHVAWTKAVCGRMKSDISYSNTLVYNNFPWPQSPTEAQRQRVTDCAEGVLNARANYPDSTLAQLYDPLLMPADLLRAHQQLDRAVERCYRPEPFASDRDRVEFLFALYEKLSSPLLPAAPRPRRRRATA
jgi:hypothetical protein